MKTQEKIFIIGHKNPDTDSICAAIAYADIKTRSSQGTTHYLARRAGHINEETAYVLNRFGIVPPAYLPNVGTQVKDMDIHALPSVDKTMTIKTAWELMKENSVVTLPVVDEERHLEGLFTINDIAKSMMDTTGKSSLAQARPQYQRIAETIEGTILSGDSHSCFENGDVFVVTSDHENLAESVHQNDLVIAGNREAEAIDAINQGISCLIICEDTPVPDTALEIAKEKGTVVISSPLDTFSIVQLINQSMPIGCMMKTSDLITFSTEDYTDNVQAVMAKIRHQAFPVIDKKGRCIGTISRRNLLDIHKKKVILVDHNDKDQAADNIEQAEILEIIDHHKVGSLETTSPISFRNLPVGCTCTIMYQLYLDQKLEISPSIAGLLCSAIISDTLMFRSPTCTLQDKMAAGALALLAGIDIEQHAKAMFRAGSDLMGKSPDQIFYQDYKKFIGEGNLTFGVGQISSMDNENLETIKAKLLPFLHAEAGKNDTSMVFFMLTNILDESTELLYEGEGSETLIQEAFQVEPTEGVFILPGVVSRKKQLIPAIMESMQASERSV